MSALKPQAMLKHDEAAKVTNFKKEKLKNTNNNDVRTVSSVIVQFLSTPNLVAFSGCNKACKSAVQIEVINRKERIAKTNTRVEELLGLTGYNDKNADSEGQFFHNRRENPLLPTRANVLEAECICEVARKIIDTDMNWQHLINSVGWMGGELCLSSIDKLFEEEREVLKSERDMRILPMNFYHACDGSEPSQNLEERHMNTATNSRMWQKYCLNSFLTFHTISLLPTPHFMRCGFVAR
jgi:hypothetical protein